MDPSLCPYMEGSTASQCAEISEIQQPIRDASSLVLFLSLFPPRPPPPHEASIRAEDLPLSSVDSLAKHTPLGI